MFSEVKEAPRVIKSLYENRRLALNLAKNDFKSKFAGSYLGIIWAFIQPIMTVLIYWFVFEVGFRAGRGTDYPFVLFLISGIVPWFFFSEALSGGCGSLVEYRYLVKKVVFNIEILPFVKVISAGFVHLFFVVFAIIVFCLYGYFPSAAIVMLIYYIICNFVLVLGLTYFFSAITVFFLDMKQVVNIIILQFGMWLTPIMWDANTMLSDKPLLLKIIKLNPMYYIVDGFRGAMLFGRFLGNEKLGLTIYFWLFSLLAFVIGTAIFKRLRVHFADVL